METLSFYLCDTEIGWIGLAFSSRGLRRATVPQRSREATLGEVMALGATKAASPSQVDDLAQRLRHYAGGKGISFADVALDWDGTTPFGRSVLRETLRISWGERRSYRWLAQQLGRPRAARAIGQALARNPFPIIVPCHRVIASDGSLGGYTGGLAMKERLLRLESEGQNPLGRTSGRL